MVIITKQEFLKQEPKNGGDLWNSYKLHRIAFKKFPEAVKIQYNLSTGLWCDIAYWTESGEEKHGSIYDGDDNRF